MLLWFAGPPVKRRRWRPALRADGSLGVSELIGREVERAVRSLANQSPLSPIGPFWELSSNKMDMVEVESGESIESAQ